MSAPTVYATVMDERTRKLREHVEEFLSWRFRDFQSLVVGEVEGLVRDAYIAGVKDGFAQGVAAEVEKRP